MRIDIAIRRSRRPSLTSLIDVIFLLLLFFMLSSTFTRFSEVEIAGSSTGNAVSENRPDIIVKISGLGWRVNGEQPGSEERALDQLAALERAGAKSAAIFFGSDQTSQALVSAIEAIGRQTGLTVSVSR